MLDASMANWAVVKMVGNYGPNTKGDLCRFPKEVAENLIGRGLAVAAEPPAKAIEETKQAVPPVDKMQRTRKTKKRRR